jgi:hypothetical protein
MNRLLTKRLSGLLDTIEDLRLGALIDAVKDDEALEGESSLQAYLLYRNETEMLTDKEENDLDQDC